MEKHISNPRFTQTLTDWWSKLDTTGPNRATRAILKRCATLDEVALSPAYQRVYRYMLACELWDERATPKDNDKLAAIIGLLASVKMEDADRLPRRMSDSGDNDRPLVSEMRFRNLLLMESADDIFRGLRRALPMIKYQANIHQLVKDVYYWGDKTKKEWAYAYRWPAKPAV